MNQIIQGDCLDVLATLPDKFASLIYIDPPFNTGKVQKRQRISVSATDHEGEREGFGGRRYNVEKHESGSYADKFNDFQDFLISRIQASLHCLTENGSLFVHLDYREVHYIKVALDNLIGRENLINEIIWSYDYGGRPKNRWPNKHDTILWYTLNPENYIFNYDEIDRIPYMAPGLVGAEKAERGKTPTDVWWNTIVPTNGKEKTGYPTQKPLGIMNRIVRVHSNPGDMVLDYFCGSGSTGEAAAANGRNFTLVDQNPEAISVSKERLAKWL